MIKAMVAGYRQFVSAIPAVIHRLAERSQALTGPWHCPESSRRQCSSIGLSQRLRQLDRGILTAGIIRLG